MSLIKNKNDSSVGEAEKVDGQPDLLGWLRGKVAAAEKSLKIREDMAATYREGTNAEWVAAAAMYPATHGKAPTKAERLKQAHGHDQIAAKLRHELAMFRAVRAALSPAINPE